MNREMSLIRYRVGDPYPGPLAGEGLQMTIEPAERSLNAMLVAGLARPSVNEVEALTRAPIRLGLLVRSPIIYVVMAGAGIDLDAAVAHAGDATRGPLVAAARAVYAWDEEHRGLLTVTTVDTASGMVRGLRAVSLSRQWWATLATGLEACPVATTAERERVNAETYRRYPTPAAMLADCSIIEMGGAL
ncbi:hypothetical protein [Methylobacterium sp. ID0610]|uniref:hypothetical protein n=1 Tax=Methylobacterium carpenticola TaxID=3344827 RepID=UPI0036B1628C